jgi:hypothetical protein
VLGAVGEVRAVLRSAATSDSLNPASTTSVTVDALYHRARALPGKVNS